MIDIRKFRLEATEIGEQAAASEVFACRSGAEDTRGKIIPPMRPLYYRDVRGSTSAKIPIRAAEAALAGIWLKMRHSPDSRAIPASETASPVQDGARFNWKFR
jgi:hypothetical protein